MDIPADVEERLADLDTRRDWAEMNAERMEDMDNPAGAAWQRQEAVRLREEFEALAQEYGIDLEEDNF